MHWGRKKTLMDRAQEYAESVAETVAETVKPHLEAAKPHLESARDQAVGAARDAADKAGPALNDARDRAAPLIAEGRARAAEAAAVGAALAQEKAAQGAAIASEKAAEGRELAASRIAEIKGEPEPKKGSVLKRLLLLGGLAAIGAVVLSKLRGQSDSDNWQSSYVPTPPPAGGGTPTEAPGAAMGTTTAEGSNPAEGLADPLHDPLPSDSSAPGAGADTAGGTTPASSVEDPAGGTPGEALTDSHETPHAATTPDEPAEVVEIDQDPDAPRA